MYFSIANSFIEFAGPEGLTAMKLQRLLYITYSEYLRRTGTPLFSTRFAVWKYGPVLESVYHEFEGCENKPINRYYKNNNGDVKYISENTAVGSLISYMWHKYGDWNIRHLNALICNETFAWQKAKDKGLYYMEDEDIKQDMYMLR